MTSIARSPAARPAGEAEAHDEAPFEFTLFVSGASDLSARAIANARQLFDANVAGRYRLAVIDIHDDPSAVLSNHVLAVPVLIKHRPAPVRRLIGDLSRPEQVLRALGLLVPDATPGTGR
jgi:circadian clock protein KaiB